MGLEAVVPFWVELSMADEGGGLGWWWLPFSKAELVVKAVVVVMVDVLGCGWGSGSKHIMHCSGSDMMSIARIGA